MRSIPGAKVAVTAMDLFLNYDESFEGCGSLLVASDKSRHFLRNFAEAHTFSETSTQLWRFLR